MACQKPSDLSQDLPLAFPRFRGRLGRELTGVDPLVLQARPYGEPTAGRGGHVSFMQCVVQRVVHRTQHFLALIC